RIRGSARRAHAGPEQRRRRMRGSQCGSRPGCRPRRGRRGNRGAGDQAHRQHPDQAGDRRARWRHRQWWRALAALAQLPAGHVPLAGCVLEALLRRLRRDPDPIDPALWRDACAGLPWLRGLDSEADAVLAALAARFLAQKTITPLGGLELGAREQVQLAALCCLPLLRFGAEGLHGWSQLLVYPDAFRVNRSHVDAAGVMHEWEDELIGEAWDSGPLILSWADIQAEIAEPDAGYCVAVHEMAHKIDLLDGVLDGTPPLPRAWQREWARDFQQAYDALVR